MRSGRRTRPRAACRILLALLAAALLSAASATARDLGDILVEKGLITPEELREAREEEHRGNAADESQLAALKAKLPAWIDMFTPFGDIRLRNEGFYQDDKIARSRFRARARIGVTVAASNELAGTVRLATGNADDPISTNQTLGDVFSRRGVNLDWAYLTLTPGETVGLTPGWLTVTAGKFGVSAYRPSELVWDDDIAPEGATETVRLVEKRTGFVRRVTLSAFQWIVDEVADGADPWIPGGQLVVETALPPWATWTFALADFYFDGIDTVARRSLDPYYDPPADTKANPHYNSQLANSNAVERDASGRIVGYRSGFNVLDVGTALDAADPFGLGIPAGIFAELAYNTEASDRNLGFYLGAGIGRARKDWYRNVLLDPGDWAVSYTCARVEQDAVLSIFSFSDINEFSSRPAQPDGARPTQKGATNLLVHIVRLDYAPLPHLQLTAKAYVENVLDRSVANVPLTQNRTLLRTQLDAMFRF